MRMSGCPGLFGGKVSRDCGDAPDLEPSEDNVKSRCIADEAERASDFLGTTKISEKNKQIAWTDVVPREMTLRCARLPEHRTPSCGARDRIAAQIGIEMRAVASTDLAARKVFHNFRDWRAVEWRNLLV